MEALPAELSWLTLEMEVANILSRQQIHGWHFDVKQAQQLEQTLRREVEQLEPEVVKMHPLILDVEFTPKRANKTKGWHEGATFSKLKDFSPTSRQDVAWVLQTFSNWIPQNYTKSTSKKNKLPVPEINEGVLKEIGTKESLVFLRLLTLQKQLGLLSEGKNAWMKLVESDDRIHHRCKVDTSTHRCSHSSPNLAQVPSDLEFRKLFTATPGLVMVGADLSGIELRMLAHYLARYDDGAYAKILLEDDIHQVNADKIGCSRRDVKTVTYAFLYGAGDTKVGLSLDPSLSTTKAAKRGKEIKEAFVQAIPGLAQLLKGVQRKATHSGYINSIDGRKIYCDSAHKALNYLLQSGAGIVAKRWMRIADQRYCALSHQLAFIHDELQYETTPENAEYLANTLRASAVRAGEFYDLRIPIAAEAKIGKNWAEVH